MNTNKRVTSRESRVSSPIAARAQKAFGSPLSALHSPPRGILLLVVLSMLTLFLLIGTAFIVSADHYRKTQKTLAKLTETSNSSIDQGNLLEEVINQLVRDTNNQNSTLRFHSLLRDMYGNDGVSGEVFHLDDATDPGFVTVAAKFAGAQPHPSDQTLLRGPTDGQFVEFAVYHAHDAATSTGPEDPKDIFGVDTNLSAIDNYYNGQVLTWLSGPTSGQSTRIIGYRYDSGLSVTDLSNNTFTGFSIFRVVAFPTADGKPLEPTRGNPSSSHSPEIGALAEGGSGFNHGAKFVINGRPFNGTGVGYNPAATAAKLNAVESVAGTNRELALMPNAAFFNSANVVTPNYFATGSNDSIGLGGSDESYDAVDFQNMLLSSVPTNPVEFAPAAWRLPAPGALSNGNQAVVIPSLHRPALINYWRNAFFHTPASTRLFEPNMLRKVVLRPSWMDHPNFTGDNPEFANLLATYQFDVTDTAAQDELLNSMIYGPWDVDNDNDGIRDSVWVDFGAPIMENADGRLVKPLAAILVLDMDGRLNLNAHGSQDIANPANFNINLAGGANSDDLPQGQGYGPAEISLGPLMPYNGSFGNISRREQRWKWYKRFFRGADRGHSIVPDLTNINDVQAVTPTSRIDFMRRQVGKFGRRPNPSNPSNPSDTGNPTDIPVPGIDALIPGSRYLTVFDISAQLKMQGVPRWANGQVADSTGTLVLGGYATSPDYRGRYAIGLNDLGQPVYEALAPSDLDSNGNPIRQNENTPYELDLSLGAARGDSQDAPDGPYTVAELERILRSYDPDAGALPSRIWELAGEFKPSAAATTPNLAMLNLWRTTLTTDSYDLPVPSVVVPGWMAVGPDGIAGPTGSPPINDDYQAVMGRPPVGLAFADLLEYRIRVAQTPNPWWKTDDAANPTRLPFIQREMRKLLPQDLADGLRLDVNRPVGNGRDDNDNGVVDEPGELEGAFWASSAPQLDAFTDDDDNSSDPYNFTGLFRDDSLLLRDYVVDASGLPDRDWNNDGMIDLNDTFAESKLARGINGVIDTLPERVAVHNLRRQMLARDLYVLAQTLVDPLPIPTAGITDPKYLERRAQRARQLAQWAINVVDFRDPDSIMTAFEYDDNPFDGWSPDGNMATTDDIYGADNKIGGVAGTPNADQGGFVWGSERPELLITETLGWHDRATENTNKEDPANDEDGDGFTNDDDQGTVPLNANETTKLPDSDYDQRLRPKGAAFVELYCPWPENPAVNSDTHAIGRLNQRFDITTNMFVSEGDWDNDGTIDVKGDDKGVNLAAVSATHADRPIASPCWRLMMYKDGGPGLNPDSHEVKLRPVLPDRSVYFTGFDPNYPQPARYSQPGPTPFARAHPDVKDAARYVNDGVAFFNDPSIAALAVPTVRPGGYMVVGAGEGTGAGPYESKLTSPTGSVNYSQQGISLNPGLASVQMQNNSGTPIVDPAGFPVQANANVGVAIINQVDISGTQTERRFTFSEPANGYPRRVEGSQWDPNKGLSGAYVPTVDIPLDDQRALFEKKGFKTLPLGTGGRLQAKKRSELNDGETRLTLPGFQLGQGFSKNIQPPNGLGGQIEEISRTIPGFKWVYLQRLANPLLPWNPEPLLPNGTTPTPGYQASLAFNPYLTIDSMGANVTVYTGVSEEERRVNPAKPKDPILRFRNRIPIDTLSSLQRGRSNNPTKPSDPDGLLQLQEFFQKRPDSKVVALLNSSKPKEVAMNMWNPEALGYINGTVAGVWKNEAGTASNGVGASGSNFRGIPDHTLGFLNEPFRAAGNNPDRPKSPLSWFTWNNRPFANGGELLQVPAYSSSQLLSAYSMRADKATATPLETADELYEKEAQPTLQRKFSAKTKKALAELLDLATDGSYGHLLNFFRTRQTDPKKDSDPTDPSTLVDDRGLVGLVRVLDYIHVPSPFVKTETWMNPASFGNANVTNVNDPRYQRQPPFNRISEYREPGRMNLNTVVSGDVWDGGLLHRDRATPADPWNPLTNNYQEPNSTYPGHLGPLYVDINTTAGRENGFLESRRGYPGTVTPSPTDLDPDDELLLLDSSVPTFFANPFRSPSAASLVPLNSLQRPETESTLLRRQAFNPGFDGQWGKPNVDDNGNGIVDELGEFVIKGVGKDFEDKDPAFGGTTNLDYNHADRNAYFRYQPITRLSSMTTNRSNVYAVWVTVGFFEVTEADDWVTDENGVQARFNGNRDLYDKVYPEGYQFGKEAGSDTGDLRRVREFAMIDRTVPVAFEPGQNHNIDKAIRLRRRIE